MDRSPKTASQNAAIKPVLKVWLDAVCPFCLLAKVPMIEAIEGLVASYEFPMAQPKPPRHLSPAIRFGIVGREDVCAGAAMAKSSAL